MKIIEKIDKYLDEDEKSWKGIRCKYCGALKINGKCPVNKKDCGRK
jgi:hypothetical protein